MKRKTIRSLIKSATIVAVFTSVHADASTNVFDFNSDPSGFLNIARSGDNAEMIALAGAWFPSAGSTLELGVDPSTNGYLAITQTTPTNSAHGMGSTIIFEDFDGGLSVAGFSFSCDVRVGAGSNTPADGFSINFARNTDPVLSSGGNNGFGNGPNNNPTNGREEGTTTGLVISFDAFRNSPADTIGLTIKVDNNVVTNFAMPVLNGACNNVSSLQTGPNSAPVSVSKLCWQPLNVSLDLNGLLNVTYKGVTILTNFQPSFVPGPGRLILAGRTGGSYQEQDVDNIRIVTLVPDKPFVTGSVGNGSGFKVNIVDQSTMTPDTNTIAMTLDGAAISPTSIVQTGTPGGGDGVTTVIYQNPSVLLAPGSVHTNTIEYTGSSFEGTVRKTNVFIVPSYTLLTTAHQAPGTVNSDLSGFAGRVHQLPINRPTDPFTLERHLANGFINPTNGLPYANIALADGFASDTINWFQNQTLGGVSGFFNEFAAPPANVTEGPIPGIDPGVNSNTNNLSAEILTILDLPAGSYQLGVNHQDGYKLTAGAEPRDILKASVVSVGLGKGDASPINIVVSNSGKYPVRLIWGEGSGSGELEFYLIDFATGQRILINDRVNPVQIISYADTNALTLPYVRWAFPAPDESNVVLDRPITVKLQDGTAGTITSGSISLKLNGVGTPTIVKTGGETTVTLTNALPNAPSSTLTLVYSTSLGGPFTNTWSFTTGGQTIFSVQLNEGAGTNTVEDIFGLQGFFLNTPNWTNSTPTGAASDFAIAFDGAGAKRATIPDPSQLINLGPNYLLGPNGDYTLECWVNLPAGFTPAARMIMFTYEGEPGFAFSINNTRALHTTTYGLNDINSPASIVPNDGQWHHVAVAHKNGSSMKFYIDGVLTEEVAYFRGPGVRNNPTITVGSASNGTGNPMTGTLDRIRFRKGALIPSMFDFPAPIALSIQRSGNSVTLSWSTLAGNLVLQSADALAATTTWTDVAGTPTVDGATASQTVTLESGPKFYSLRRNP